MAITHFLPHRWRVRLNTVRNDARGVVRALRGDRRTGWRAVTGESHIEVRHVPKRNLVPDRPLDRSGPDGQTRPGGTVVFAETGTTLELGPDETILEAGLRNGVDLLFSCTLGGCGACMLQIREGEVDYDDPDAICLTDEEIEAGCCLACIGKPRGRVVLEA